MEYNFLYRAIKSLFAVVLVCIASVVNADVVSSTDAGKKTMSKFMVNLAKFVTWPDSTFESATAPYKYCILGTDTMGSVLDDAMDGKNARKRAFEIQRMEITDLDSAKGCHVVFISAASPEERLRL
jgi:hypothetical protein